MNIIININKLISFFLSDMKVKTKKEKIKLVDLPSDIYIQPNKLLLTDKPIKTKRRIKILSIPKKGIFTCVNADVLSKREIIPKLSKEIDYLIDIQNKENLESKRNYILSPIKNITNDDYYFKKYPPVSLNILIDNVLKNQQYKKSDIFSKDFDYEKHKIKEKKKKLNKNEELYHQIVQKNLEKKDQNIFENFIKLKTLEEKYNTVLKKSINDIEKWDTIS